VLSRVASVLGELLARSDPDGMRGLAELDGTLLRVELTGLAPFLVRFAAGRFDLMADEGDTGAQLTLSGSAVALAGAGLSGRLDAGTLNVSGDVALAQRLRTVLAGIRPDPEELLAQRVGDVAAHHLAAAGRDALAWTRQAVSIFGSDIQEYLEEESRILAPAVAVERFSRRVEDLRDDAERLAARIARLRALRDSGP
jgi:ubiquinone biosynthesis protein UbiJ